MARVFTTEEISGTPRTGDIWFRTSNRSLSVYDGSAWTSALSGGTSTTSFGFPTGAGKGGAVTQITSRATGVTLNTAAGTVTTTADSLAALTIATHTVTNSACALRDVVILSKVSGDVDTFAWVNSTAAGSFTVSLYNSHATAADTTAFVYNYVVIKAAND